MNKKKCIFMKFEMVTILIHLRKDWIVLFHPLVDSDCACLDPIPQNASQSRLFLSSKDCVRD